ncbi:hypothetical protein [Streptomyces mexicanus]|jgi:hypothetical protein|uniref:Uncharacterized protein n=1 Tax=Streptomyces mexicanus TaxID=178566 RepID=A0A7X1I6B2_9ACTN|nr:hypothetical protein [Streptomyces mexicanus]MBC2867343.1 hypothetical protein [Streptomyces mexicanus]
MSIRPWVVVEAPDGRGLRRVTVGGEAVGSAWSLRELRGMLDRLGHGDVDVHDPASVYWRGGDSGTWPDRPWRRRVTGSVVLAGLLASAVLNAVIGWPDASGALTFAQRVTGALFVLSGLVQLAAAVSVLDFWGKRQSAPTGAIVLLGVLIALATDSLLVLLWLDERQYTPYLLAFMPLWCWSVWALRLLLREKPWKGVPQPRKFAAGVFASALFTALSLAYSTLYQPTVAPMHFALKAEFGTARADRRLPFVQVPLKISVKNTGAFSAYIVISDFTVYGRTAQYAGRGSFSGEEWKNSIDKYGEEEAERHVDRLAFSHLSSGRIYEPGTLLESGQEDTREHVFQIPADARYDLLRADLQLTYLRKDRGRIDSEEFDKQRATWRMKKGVPCISNDCGDRIVYLGAVRHNNNLVNVTRAAHYVLATWSPMGTPGYSLSCYHLDGKEIDLAEEKKDVARFGVATVKAQTDISLAELLKSVTPPRPS